MTGNAACFGVEVNNLSNGVTCQLATPFRTKGQGSAGLEGAHLDGVCGINFHLMPELEARRTWPSFRIHCVAVSGGMLL